MGVKLTTEEFIEKARNVHGDKYDYSLVDYKNIRSKIKIVCKKHGMFEQQADAHNNGQGCRKCYDENQRMSHQYFIQNSIKKHKNEYDYSLVNYINNDTKIKIICKKHGEFEQTPANHLYYGNGCKICRNESQTLSTQDFIKKSNAIHDNKFNYSLVNYENLSKKVKIICPVHGEFLQLASNHVSGYGCPKCNSSKLENTVRSYLSKNNIKFEEQKRFDFIRNKNPLPFDFYLTEYNCCIECQGEQHFSPVNFGGRLDKTKYERFSYIKKNDEIKFNKCREHKINLYYYTKRKNIIDGYFSDVETLLKIIKNEK